MTGIDDPGYCDECGNYGVVRQARYGQPIDVCELCDALYGMPELVEHIESDREADARGIDRLIFPLVRELDEIHGVRCFETSEGDPAMKIPPFANFHIGNDGALHILEALLTSLSASNRLVRGHWHIEVLLSASVGFSLRPKLPPDEGRQSPWIELCQQDIEILARQFAAHKKLPWWRV